MSRKPDTVGLVCCVDVDCAVDILDLSLRCVRCEGGDGGEEGVVERFCMMIGRGWMGMDGSGVCV